MAASCSFVTCFMRMRAEWNVKRSGSTPSRARSMAGISVSIVMLELGTIWPMRKCVRGMAFPCSMCVSRRECSGP